MRYQGLFMVLGFFELSVIGMLWSVAVTALARRISGFYSDGTLTRDVLLAEGFVTFGPMTGACLGAIFARFLQPTLLGYGTGVVFGATFGLVAALAYARNVLRRVTHDDVEQVRARRRGDDVLAGLETRCREAVDKPARSLDPQHRPLRSHRRPSRLIVR